jgi:hypothetical protein
VQVRLVAITCSGVALAERPMPALFTSACSCPPPSSCLPTPSPPSRRPKLASTCAVAAATEASSETSMVTSATRPAQSAVGSRPAARATQRRPRRARCRPSPSAVLLGELPAQREADAAVAAGDEHAMRRGHRGRSKQDPTRKEGSDRAISGGGSVTLILEAK